MFFELIWFLLKIFIVVIVVAAIIGIAVVFPPSIPVIGIIIICNWFEKATNR